MAPHPVLSLAGDFPAATREQWLGLVAKALKRDTADEAMAALRSATLDGLTIEPLYTAADAVDPSRVTRPTRRGPWDVRQRVDAATGAAGVLDELERGATSVWLEVPPGSAPSSQTDVAALVAAALDGVLVDIAPVVLAAGAGWDAAAPALVARAEEVGGPLAPGSSLGADPLGDWASDRRRHPDRELDEAAAWATRLAAGHPGVTAVTIDGTRFHDAGASDAVELGTTLAVAVATARELARRGVDDPFAAVALRLAATDDQFATIAKFRAIRHLWARVAEASGAAAAAAGTALHAVGSTAMLTRYDPAVNMLRSTVACFAAGVAGADAITVLPHDACSAAIPSELGRRVARNTQTVLALESHLGAVADPAGGSWYVEARTAAVAEVAWAWFQEIEAASGFRAATASGAVAARIADDRRARDEAIDHRRAPITGVSEFPNIAEPVPTRDLDDGRQDRDDGSLPVHRWSERFEALRSRVDRHTAAIGQRPRVYLATLGTPAEFTARATFAKNFFEVAGIETITGPPDGFADATATVACVCSSNAVYAEYLDPALDALRAAGAGAVHVAGRDPIVLGGDALATLTAIVTELGVTA